jgi:aspartyl-tRNA(Asn)/glutamyl-tRNA(Gln) amidotransferase subunit C
LVTALHSNVLFPRRERASTLSRRVKTQKATSVDIREVEKLAGLSRLSLGQQEAERLRGELSSILEYFATLDKVDVSKVAQTQGVQDGLLREDVVRPSTPEDILRGVPQKKGRYVRAPRVF